MKTRCSYALKTEGSSNSTRIMSHFLFTALKSHNFLKYVIQKCTDRVLAHTECSLKEEGEVASEFVDLQWSKMAPWMEHEKTSSFCASRHRNCACVHTVSVWVWSFHWQRWILLPDSAPDLHFSICKPIFVQLGTKFEHKHTRYSSCLHQRP